MLRVWERICPARLIRDICSIGAKLDNKTVIIPNAKLTGDNIINYSTKGTRRLDLVIGVSYSDDLKKVRKVMEDILDDDSRVLDDPPAKVDVLQCLGVPGNSHRRRCPRFDTHDQGVGGDKAFHATIKGFEGGLQSPGKVSGKPL